MTQENNDTPQDTPEAEAPVAPPRPQPAAATTLDGEAPLYFWGLGRRKSSVARVRIKPGGTGKVMVNKRDLEKYFYRAQDVKNVLDPLKLTKQLDKFDVFVNVNGGGMSGQSGAARMGVARALISYDPGLADMLRSIGYLTRDSRQKERKKYGQRGARASFQFSKR